MFAYGHKPLLCFDNDPLSYQSNRRPYNKLFLVLRTHIIMLCNCWASLLSSSLKRSGFSKQLNIYTKLYGEYTLWYCSSL